MADPKKPNNARTAWILASVAVVFFISVYARRLWLS